MRENQASMSSSIEVLLKGSKSIVFCRRWNWKHQKITRTSKGLPKLHFLYLNKIMTFDLEILPVGINFTYPTVFNSEVMLKIGAPIRVKDYFELYRNDKRQAYDQLTEEFTMNAAQCCASKLTKMNNFWKKPCPSLETNQSPMSRIGLQWW